MRTPISGKGDKNMNKSKLDKWAEHLLDTGKRSNLVNFKDTKSSTVEILSPRAEVLFDKIDASTALDVYDITDKGEDETFDQGGYYGQKYSKEVFISSYSKKLKRNQMLVFNAFTHPVSVIKNIHKKARMVLEETGVNVAYMSFGFVHWKDADTPESEYRAPLLLVPVIFKNESAVEPYCVKFTDDEVIVNPTFSFRMNSEFGVRLPEYDGEGLCEYLGKVEALVSKLGWRVTNGVRIGIFSFLKLNMYKDLKDNKDAILENENVRLILGDYPLENDIGASENFEDTVLNNVVDADSSQLDAIRMAKAGRSFVIQGPPGTGKSQTITNLIAECLADGKRVLFVSEKLAALRVVYDKLKKAGLEEFCLELHSHKANKKEFIEELCRTLRADKSSVSGRAEAIELTLEKYTKALDTYADELHKPHEEIGMSLYQLYSAYSSVASAPDADYVPENIRHLDGEHLVEAIRLLMQYEEYAQTYGKNYKDNPFFGVRIKDSSYSECLKFKKDLLKTKDSLEELCKLIELVEDSYGVEVKTPEDLDSFSRILDFLSDSSIITPALCDKERRECVDKKLKMADVCLKALREKEERINREYDSDIFLTDARTLLKRMKIEFGSLIFRIFSKDYRRILTDIRLCRHDGGRIGYDEAKRILKLLDERREDKEKLSDIISEICELCGAKTVNSDADFSILRKEIKRFCELKSTEKYALFFKDIECETFLKAKKEFSQTAEQIRAAHEKYAGEEQRIKERFNKGKCKLYCSCVKEKRDACLQYLSAIDTLDGYVRYLRVVDDIYKAELGDYIEAIRECEISGEDIHRAYSKAFYRAWIDSLISESAALRDFTRSSQQRSVEIFSENDLISFEVNKAKIKAALSQRRPELDLVAPGSAVSVLVREGEKNKRQKSIRTLIADIGELIQLLKPCFLMSPLSVSTYLDSGRMNFDVVVFDEASQIFPEDAIGAIYRAKQMIVVGDSNQMPPSNFFTSSVDADEDIAEDDCDDRYESILDLSSTVMPKVRLKWHYRSRFEELIAFSNKHFYSGELITFPSASKKAKWQGIDYYHVNGVFEHKKRANKKEAEAVVDLIYRNIVEFPERSLGVVAFSISQQELIDKLLSKRRETSPEYEFFFRHDRPEPFFIKNLETVQGDERDTIIFSTAYGKDDRGTIMHNFGPLNRTGGERRLNVAVTRAKINLQLVSSMHSTDIDLSKARSRGARLLKEYLAFAEGGSISECEKSEINPFAKLDRGFENEVADFLIRKGFSVETKLGCSKFKIDVAVKNAEGTGYAIAIECDGERYAATRSARDRDRLRTDVLRRMGWDVYRVWSTEWYKNPKKEKERLLDAVKSAISCTAEDTTSICTDISDYIESDYAEYADEAFVETCEDDNCFPYYEYADIDALLRDIPDDFISFVKAVLIKEAPLSEEHLIRRILTVFGTDKLTGSVLAEFESMMKGCERSGIVRRSGFMFLDKIDISLRIPKDGELPRDIKYISLEELAEGAVKIIEKSVSISRDGLYHAITQILGHSRLTAAISARMDSAIDLIRDRIHIDKNTFSAIRT